MMHLTKTTLVVSIAAFLWSCSDDSRPALEIPTTYVSANFAANAATELALLNNLNALVNEAKRGRNAANTVAAATLQQLFEAGTPSAKSRATAIYTQQMEGNNGWLNQLSLASGNVYTVGAPTGNGGAWGGYLFDENGMELEQLVEKGGFGAILYNHAVSIFDSPLTATSADRLVAVFGANPTFPSSSNATLHASPDRAMAVYAARRDKNDGNGFYTGLKKAFIQLKAALEAGAEYNRERDQAVAQIKDLWEKSNAATVINYSLSVISTMSSTNPTDGQKANALHAYGEAVGFLLGWKTIAAAHKTITDAQIDALLVLLNAAPGTTPTSYLFITDPATQLPKLQQVIAQLKTIYSFSDAQIEDFRRNWIADQNR